MWNSEIKVTPLVAIILGVVALVGTFVGGFGTAGGFSKKDGFNEVYMAEVENLKTLIDPERTPFCDGESDKYDANRCAMVEMCATATGSDVEVTADCKALSNILATEWLTTLMTDFADTNWDKFSKDKSEGWQKAADYFIRQWEKRKGG